MPRFALSALLLGLTLCGGVEAELTDPTRPSFALPATNAAVQAVAALRVSAIFISGERRLALVNGSRVRVGDTVGGATVSGIERDRVSFVRGERAFSVALLSGAGRRR